MGMEHKCHMLTSRPDARKEGQLMDLPRKHTNSGPRVGKQVKLKHNNLGTIRGNSASGVNNAITLSVCTIYYYCY